MSDRTGFFTRWSQRKQNATIDRITPPKSDRVSDDLVSGASTTLGQDGTRPSFDDASLPALESIGAESDISAFLGAGVPGDLTRAALRRVWSSDPAIRDFVGLSENSGDFNAPGAMAGFGPIDREEVGRLLTRLLGEPDSAPDTASHPPAISPVAENLPGGSGPIEYQSADVETAAPDRQLDLDKVRIDDDVAQWGGATAPQSQPDKSECPPPDLGRRSHGAASPRLASGEGTDNSG